MELDHLLHKAINLVLTPLVFAIICLILPFLIIFRLVVSISSRFSSENMARKVVLITGASSGIGEHMAYEYAKMGACLALVARRKEKLEAVAARARGLGSPDVLALRADVSNVNDCKRSIDDTINHFGKLNHLVNNAGIGSVCALEEITDITNSGSLMDVNYWGSVYPTYFAIPHLRKTKGKIVVNSSTSALVQPPSMSFYTSSKAAVIGFFESLRGELDPEVTVSIVTLGFVESEMTEGKLVSGNGEVIVAPNLIKLFTDCWVNELGGQAISPTGLPKMRAGLAAKVIVDAICRGERYVTEPKWYRMLTLFKYLCPEVIEWHFRQTKFGKVKEAPSNHIPSKAD
ncbi:11-beta-hydroxysteroid dehydrogenase 1B [Vitis vinifera]|nr:11-beta-hydroxysteroid dehydrogenase 1B [Vitis vinifera]